MTKESYLWWQAYFKNHSAHAQLAHMCASQLAATAVLVPLLAVWFPAGRLYIAWAGLCLMVGWLGFVQIIARLFPRKRPYQLFGFVPVTGQGLFSHLDTVHDAFPSGHTTALCILSFTLLPFSLMLGGAVLGLALCAGGCRVLLGWHFTRDVVAGVLLAAGVVLVLYGAGLFAILEKIVL